MIKSITIFPSLSNKEIKDDIKQQWVNAYPGCEISTWNYTKSKYFVKNKYPKIYNDLKKYFEPEGSDEPGISSSYNEYVLIICRFLVAFHSGGIIVSESISPLLLIDNTNSDESLSEEIVTIFDAAPKSPHIFTANGYNTLANAMIDLLYAPYIGNPYWLEIIETIKDRSTKNPDDVSDSRNYLIANYSSDYMNNGKYSPGVERFLQTEVDSASLDQDSATAVGIALTGSSLDKDSATEVGIALTGADKETKEETIAKAKVYTFENSPSTIKVYLNTYILNSDVKTVTVLAGGISDKILKKEYVLNRHLYMEFYMACDILYSFSNFDAVKFDFGNKLDSETSYSKYSQQYTAIPSTDLEYLEYDIIEAVNAIKPELTNIVENFDSLIEEKISTALLLLSFMSALLLIYQRLSRN